MQFKLTLVSININKYYGYFEIEYQLVLERAEKTHLIDKQVDFDWRKENARQKAITLQIYEHFIFDRKNKHSEQKKDTDNFKS